MTYNVSKIGTLLSIFALFILFACNPADNSHRISSRSSSVYNKQRTKAHKKNKNVATTYSKRTSSTSTSAISSQRKDILKEAKKYQGIPYQYGGKKPSSGFDCSGLVSHCYKASGITLSGSSDMMARQGKARALGAVVPGDLLFFGTQGKVSHVAIAYKKEGNDVYVIHATSKAGVKVDNITASKYWMNRYLFTRDLIDM